MRIAFINQPWNTVVPPVEAGSIAIWTYEVARRLARDHEVILYSKREPGQPGRQSRDGIEFRRFPVGFDRWVERMRKRLRARTARFSNRPRQTPLFASGSYYLGYILHAARDLQSRGVDIVHVHNLVHFPQVVRTLNPKTAIVLHMHAEWLDQIPRDRAEQWLRAVSVLAGCSEYLTGLACRRFPALAGVCDTIYNGVDPDRFSPLPPGDGRQGISLLYVGRISPEKGLHVLLDALARLSAACPQVSLEIIGPDSATPLDFLVRLARDASIAALRRFYPRNYLSQLREQAETLGLGEGHVRFAGAVPHAETVHRYRQATLLVNPSLSESFGMSLIEAMACGLPVIATRLGGMVEVVDDRRTGYLVTPDDPRALANALLDLIQDPGKRRSMGEAGRRRVLERFTWDKVTERLIGQYRTAMRQP
ncbi:MAG: glycosyltransferase family 4 protein [Acidobacteriota bacterium]